MTLRTKEDIIFSLTGEEGIIDYKVRYVTKLVLNCKDYQWTREEMLIPYNFILANAILSGTNIFHFDGLTFESIYHVDKYILEHNDPIPLMIRMVGLIGRH